MKLSFSYLSHKRTDDAAKKDKGSAIDTNEPILLQKFAATSGAIAKRVKRSPLAFPKGSADRILE